MAGAEVLILDSPDYLFSEGRWEKAQENSGLGVKILLVCMEEDEQLFLRAIRAGVVGFVPKDAPALDVVAAVRSLARGEAVCPAGLCKFLFDFVAAQTAELPSSYRNVRLGLTRREQAVDSDDRSRADEQRNRQSIELVGADNQEPRAPNTAQSGDGKSIRHLGRARVAELA